MKKKFRGLGIDAYMYYETYKKFIENGIKHCFFKGPLLSLELYQDIGYRNFGDIDILVEKDDVENAKNIKNNINMITIGDVLDSSSIYLEPTNNYDNVLPEDREIMEIYKLD